MSAALAAKEIFVPEAPKNEQPKPESPPAKAKEYCFLIPAMSVDLFRSYLPNAKFSKPDDQGYVRMVL